MSPLDVPIGIAMVASAATSFVIICAYLFGSAAYDHFKNRRNAR